MCVNSMPNYSLYCLGSHIIYYQYPEPGNSITGCGTFVNLLLDTAYPPPQPTLNGEAKGAVSHLEHKKEMEMQKKTVLVRKQRTSVAALGRMAANSPGEQDIWCLQTS